MLQRARRDAGDCRRARRRRAATRAVVAAHPTHVDPSADRAAERRAQERARSRRRPTGCASKARAICSPPPIAAGATRIVGGSFALIGGTTQRNARRTSHEAAARSSSMESQILDASRAGAIEGVVLRYGLFYGPDSRLDDRDDRDGAAPHAADDPRRPQPAAVHPRRRCGERDASRRSIAARPAAATTSSTIEPVSFSEIVRGARRGRRRAAADRGTVVAAAAARRPYMARMIAIRLPLSNAEGARRARLAAGVSRRSATGLRRPARRAAEVMTEVDLFQTHRPALFAVAYRMLGSASDAEDVRAGRVAPLLVGAARPTSAPSRRI